MGQQHESTDTVELSVDALLTMAMQLRVSLKQSSDVVERLVIALSIAQANGDNEVADRAIARAHGYLEELALLGAAQ